MSRPARLLLANHHRDTNTIMSRLIQRFGGVVETAETIAEAFERLGSAPFDAFICRVGMPDGCGAKAILTAWTTFGVPGIALYGTRQSQQAAAQIPCEALRAQVMMPADLNQILEAIYKSIGHSNFDPCAPGGKLCLEEKQCPDCKGTGSVALLVTCKPCTRCAGSGRVLPTSIGRPLAAAVKRSRANLTVANP